MTRSAVAVVLLLVLLAACAPGHTPTATPYGYGPTPPSRIATPVASVFDATATYQGAAREMAPHINGWRLTTDAFRLAVTLEPRDLQSYSDAALLAYDQASPTYGSRPEYRYTSYAVATLLIELDDFQPYAIAFSLYNDTAEPISIVWDESAIIMPDGASSRVIPSQKPFIRKDEPTPPTVVPPTGRVDDVATPIESVSYYNDWNIEPFFYGDVAAGDTVALYIVVDVAGEHVPTLVTFEAQTDWSDIIGRSH
jgi:hypothetical protein